MPLNAQTSYLLQHTANALLLQADQVLRERFEIGYSQFKVLMFLEGRSSATQKAIAKSLGQTEASINRQVKLMQDIGLIRILVNPKNRRERIITQTASGQRLCEATINTLSRYYAEAFNTLSEKQRVQLISALTTIHHNVCINPNQPGSCYPA